MATRNAGVRKSLPKAVIPEDPVTKKQLISWAKLFWPILPVTAAIVTTLINFGGDSKASEMKVDEAIVSLKQDVITWKTTMVETTRTLQDFNVTLGRVDERLKGVDKRLEKLEGP